MVVDPETVALDGKLGLMQKFLLVVVVAAKDMEEQLRRVKLEDPEAEVVVQVLAPQLVAATLPAKEVPAETEINMVVVAEEDLEPQEVLPLRGL